MEKQTYQQLDRIENNQNTIINGLNILMTDTQDDILTGLYEQEIQNPKGQLHHLNQDQKVTQFFQQILTNQETEEPQEETSGEEGLPYDQEDDFTQEPQQTQQKQTQQKTQNMYRNEYSQRPFN